MSIRTYLIFSYLALVLLVTLGMWLAADQLMDKLTETDLRVADEAILDLSTSNFQTAKQMLTNGGESFVIAKADGVAKGVAILLAGKKPYNYASLRRDETLRKIATQDVITKNGVVGYLDLIDNTGVAVLHPNREVEGKNFSQWKDEFPEMWNLVSRSFKEPRVEGYYTFLDRNNQKRDKYMVLVQVPATPFIMVATVNMDQFFLPAFEKMRNKSQETMAKARNTLETINESIDWKAKVVGLGVGLAFSLLGGLFGLYFATSLSRPILKLRDGVEEVGEGNFAVAVPEKGVKEVAQLARSFNRLGEQLTEYIEKRDFIRDTFGRYVTQEVVRKLLESKEALEMGGETREVSIIMSDLRGFTAITADMAPEQVIAFLNRYLSKMIEILLDHRAVIDEILGDGILAFFGAPEPLEDHPAQAVACALEMQAAMEEINALNAADSLPHLEMGVGVNTGTVVVGNIGSERRTKYSVVGSDVNFASRMEAYALPGQVLISASTYHRIKDLTEVRGVLHVEMKGLPGMATLYDIRGLGGAYNIRLRDQAGELAPLPEKIRVRIARLKDKIVTATLEEAWITHLSDRAAQVALKGKLREWEDVRLSLLDKNLEEIPGHIYGKVTLVKHRGGERQEAVISFTTVSPEIYRIIRRAPGEA